MKFLGTQVGHQLRLRAHFAWSDGDRHALPKWHSDSPGVTLWPEDDGSCRVNCELEGFAVVDCVAARPGDGALFTEQVVIGVMPAGDSGCADPVFLGLRITGHDE